VGDSHVRDGGVRLPHDALVSPLGGHLGPNGCLTRPVTGRFSCRHDCETHCETFRVRGDNVPIDSPRCIIGVWADSGKSLGTRAFIATDYKGAPNESRSTPGSAADARDALLVG
jgi:hypothetical protein